MDKKQTYCSNVRIIGLDPGLRNTGWGIIEDQNNRFKFIASGTIKADPILTIGEKLNTIYACLSGILEEYSPMEAAIETVFVNKDAKSTLKLGQARGICLLAPSRLKIPIWEYAPNSVKKSIIGVGHGDKKQIQHMVKFLLPKVRFDGPDSADALAISLCHAYHRMGNVALARRTTYKDLT